MNGAVNLVRNVLGEGHLYSLNLLDFAKKWWPDENDEAGIMHGTPVDAGFQMLRRAAEQMVEKIGDAQTHVEGTVDANPLLLQRSMNELCADITKFKEMAKTAAVVQTIIDAVVVIKVVCAVGSALHEIAIAGAREQAAAVHEQLQRHMRLQEVRSVVSFELAQNSFRELQNNLRAWERCLQKGANTSAEIVDSLEADRLSAISNEELERHLVTIAQTRGNPIERDYIVTVEVRLTEILENFKDPISIYRRHPCYALKLVGVLRNLHITCLALIGKPFQVELTEWRQVVADVLASRPLWHPGYICFGHTTGWAWFGCECSAEIRYVDFRGEPNSIQLQAYVSKDITSTYGCANNVAVEVPPGAQKVEVDLQQISSYSELAGERVDIKKSTVFRFRDSPETSKEPLCLYIEWNSSDFAIEDVSDLHCQRWERALLESSSLPVAGPHNRNFQSMAVKSTFQRNRTRSWKGPWAETTPHKDKFSVGGSKFYEHYYQVGWKGTVPLKPLPAR